MALRAVKAVQSLRVALLKRSVQTPRAVQLRALLFTVSMGSYNLTGFMGCYTRTENFLALWAVRSSRSAAFKNC